MAKVKYVAERLLHAVALLVAVSFLSFVLAQIAPGDYYTQLRGDPRILADTAVALRTHSGIDRPLPVRYAAWVGGILRGDFGYSLAYHAPVASILRQRTGNTLLLTGTATVLAWLVAVPLGVWSASRRGKWFDGASSVAVSILLSIPDLVLAIALLWLAVRTGWFPLGGKSSAAQSGWRDIAWHMILPVVVLVAGLAPVLVRHARASMLEVMDAGFALSARAQGIPRRRRFMRHLLPAALNPLVTLFGISLGTLLSESLLVEVVMGWPGLGPLFLEAIMARDFAIVLAVAMVSAGFLVLGNLAADLLLDRMDPRIRSGNA